MFSFPFNQINTLEDLVYALLNEIGLELDDYGIVHDSDSGAILSFNGRQIKASIDPNNPAIPTDLFVILDPVFDNKVMSFLLGYYLQKEQAYGNLNPLGMTEELEPIQYYNKDDNIKTKRSRITISLLGGEKVSSIFYYQRGLKYSDIILRLGGQQPDLHLFDSIPEECITLIPPATNNYPKDDDIYY